MFLSLLSARAVTRGLVASSFSVSRRVVLPQITRSFSVSRIAWAPTAKATSTSKTAAKKPAAKKAAKKPATKKPKKKTRVAAKKPKPKKKAVKKKVLRVVIKPGQRPPKRPGGPYNYYFRKHFAGAQRVEGETATVFVQRVAKEAGAAWKLLSPDEKQPFVDEFNADSAEYKKKLEEYIKTTDPAVINELNRRAVKRGKRKVIKQKRNFVNGFSLFVREQRQAVPTIHGVADNQAFFKEQAGKWRSLSEEAKQTFKEKAVAVNQSTKN